MPDLPSALPTSDQSDSAAKPELVSKAAVPRAARRIARRIGFRMGLLLFHLTPSSAKHSTIAAAVHSSHAGNGTAHNSDKFWLERPNCRQHEASCGAAWWCSDGRDSSADASWGDRFPMSGHLAHPARPSSATGIPLKRPLYVPRRRTRSATMRFANPVSDVLRRSPLQEALDAHPFR